MPDTPDAVPVLRRRQGMWLLVLMILVMPYEANPYLYIAENLFGIFPDFTVIKLLGLLGFAWAAMQILTGSPMPGLLGSRIARLFLLFFAGVVFAGLFSGTGFVAVSRYLAFLLFLPFVLGVVGNMITGSTTVGVITAASIAAPMMTTLGLTPEATMLAGAAGSIIIKYVNSSYFWVCTSLSRMPLLAATMSVFLFSLTGIPPFAGFIGKVYLFKAVIERDLWWLALIGVLNSVVSLYYYARIIKAMYLDDPPEAAEPIRVPLLYTVVLLVLAIPTLWFGIRFGLLDRLSAYSLQIFSGS